VPVIGLNGWRCAESTRWIGSPRLLARWPQALKPEAETEGLCQEITQKEAAAQQLLHRVIEVQEEERRRLARELHDDLAQTLTTLTLGPEAALQTLPETMTPVREELTRVKDLTTATLGQTHRTLAEVPFRVEPILVGVTPQRVKAGETFTVHLKGGGWTELDNALAVTYDNGYIGYACGFNSNGDTQINLVATGGPGIHLIDLYPMIYQGHGKPPWSYQVPQLTYARDYPGLALG